jgi:flagellar basal-body rod protein FlgG
MTDIVDSALSILRGSEVRLSTVANNVGNVATPGFKRQVSFAQAIQDMSGGAAPPGAVSVSRRTDFGQGRMIETGNPLDLAIAGEGFFRLRDGERIVHSRHGQFHRADDGRVMTQQGYVLQQQGGGDLVVDGDVQVLRDGTILSDGGPVGRIGLALPPEAAPDTEGGSMFAGDFGEDVEAPDIRQGAVEASNVTLADEMTAMMIAVRQAETGARLIATYDELLGRAITTLGQAGR